MTASILLVEETKPSVDWILQSLGRTEYEVSLVRSEQEAIQWALAETPDLAIINATSRKIDGPRVCQTLHERTIREKVAKIPIILILAETKASHEVTGATFVLAPPFTSRKLYNRIRSILRSDEGETLRAGGLTLSLGTRRVSIGGRERRLTPKEFELLRVFMSSPGRVLSRKFLIKKIWKTDFMGDTRTLDVHICWLRRKIEDNPRSPVYLRTVRSVGYRFDMPGETGEATERKA